MIYTVDLVDKARRELVEAREWYEKKQSGLGIKFEQAFLDKVGLICNNPIHYPIKKGFHEARIDDFPYLIVYKIIKSKSLIYITSIFHTSRHPKGKHK